MGYFYRAYSGFYVYYLFVFDTEYYISMLLHIEPTVVKSCAYLRTVLFIIALLIILYYIYNKRCAGTGYGVALESTLLNFIN